MKGRRGCSRCRFSRRARIAMAARENCTRMAKGPRSSHSPSSGSSGSSNDIEDGDELGL